MAEQRQSRPSYVRIYADDHGDSHFEAVYLPESVSVEGIFFRQVLSEASDTDPHNAPQRLLIVQLDGAVEVEVSDGEKRRFGPGSVVVLEDTTGKGHLARNASGGERSTLVAPLA